MKSAFVWLGSGRARKRGVGPAGALLDQAAAAGLPAPTGAILLDDFYRRLVAAGLVQNRGDRLALPDAPAVYDQLYSHVRFPDLGGPANFQLLDPSGAVVASRDYVPVADATRLTTALADLYQHAGAWPDDARRDLLITRPPHAVHHGEATLLPDKADDMIVPDDGPPWWLPIMLAGERPSAARLVNESANPQPPPDHLTRLQKLLRGVRRTLGDQPWAVAWADDGRVCRLTAVAPLRERPSETVLLAPLPGAEAWPVPPTPLSVAVLARAAAEHPLLATPPGAAARELIFVVNGWPHVNVTRLADRLRRLGLPVDCLPEAWAAAVPDSTLRWRRWLQGDAWRRALSAAPRPASVQVSELPLDTPWRPLMDAFQAAWQAYLNDLVRVRGASCLPRWLRRLPSINQRELSSVFSHLADTLLARAAREVDAGRLAAPDDVWWLTDVEVAALDGEEVWLAPRLAERRAAWGPPATTTLQRRRLPLISLTAVAS